MDTILKKKKIVDFLSQFTDIAKKEKWISHYDAESDSFAIRAPKLSEEARKEYVNDEFAFYLTPASDVQGIFIEYFLANFVAHHKDFKEVGEELKREVKEDGAVITLDKEEVKKIVPELQEVIINSLIPTGKLS